jgi:hypothetical protein
MRWVLCLFLLLPLGLTAQSLQPDPADAATSAATRFAICDEPSRWRTSAHYIRETARCAFGASTDGADLKRVALIEDIYIKSWSYAVMNKICFWLAIVLAILVLIWPSLSAVLKPPEPAPPSDPPKPPASPGLLRRAVGAASVQTSITALAAVTFTFYAHYKTNQMNSENLMRQLLYAEKLSPELIATAISSIRDMDKGFGFSPIAKPAEA